MYTSYTFSGPYCELSPNLPRGQSELTPTSALIVDEVVLDVLGRTQTILPKPNQTLKWVILFFFIGPPFP